MPSVDTKYSEQAVLNKALDDVAGAIRVITSTGSSQKLIDYDVRTDGSPVYIGVALSGVATSADGWIIKKITYDASGNPTRVKIATGIYDNRASLTYT